MGAPTRTRYRASSPANAASSIAATSSIGRACAPQKPRVAAARRRGEFRRELRDAERFWLGPGRRASSRSATPFSGALLDVRQFRSRRGKR